MSTIKRYDLSYLAADTSLLDTVALEVLWENPAAILDLIYGPGRSVVGSCVPHDHAEDGGESLLYPIANHSFGTYTNDSGSRLGIPIGPPVSGSFAPVTLASGVVDRSGAKRLYCEGVTIPGGVSSLRVDLVEFHESDGKRYSLASCFRPLQSVNFKLGVTPDEVITEYEHATTGAATFGLISWQVTDLSDLGDATLDREVEFSLWLIDDLDNDVTEEHELCEVTVVPLGFTTQAREATATDPLQPQIAVRELKAGLGTISGPLASKIRETYNGLNIALWGKTPGLLDQSTPDRRRRYREPIDRAHTHQGLLVPTANGGVFSDGAAPRDAQSMGYVGGLGEGGIFVAGETVLLGSAPNLGALVHFTPDLSSAWVRFEFRRSIPAGVGALVFRFGAQPGPTQLPASFDSSQRLLVSIAITPCNSFGDIVTRLLCGPYVSPLDSAEEHFGFVEVEPEEDGAYLSNDALLSAGKKGWNRSVEITAAEQEAAQMNGTIYRVSAPVTAQLTYPPERSGEAWRPTQDCDIKIRFKMINSAGVADAGAGLLWLKCENAPGY